MLSDWRKRIPRPLGKVGVWCSIHPGGTIKSRSFLGFPTNRAQREMTRGDANAPGTSRKNGADLGQRFTACSAALALALPPLPAAAECFAWPEESVYDGDPARGVSEERKRLESVKRGSEGVEVVGRQVTKKK